MLSTIFLMIAVFGISSIISSRVVNWGIPTQATITLDKLKAGYYVFNYAHGGHYHFVLPHKKDYLSFDDPILIMLDNKDRISIKLPNGRYIHHGWTTDIDLFTSRAQMNIIKWFYENKEQFDSEDYKSFIKRAKIGKH